MVLEVAGLEGRAVPRRRLLLAVLGARVAALAVDHHRAGQDERIDTALVHRGEERRGAEVVVAGVQRQVGHRDAGADHRRLVADHVDAVEQVGPLRRVAYVEPVHVRTRGGTGTVRLRDQRVDPHHLVATGA